MDKITSTGASFTPSELLTRAKALIKAGFPMLIKGSAGCGKTEIILRAVRELNAEGFACDTVLCHPVTDEPVDYKGLPFRVDNKTAGFLPFGILRHLIDVTTPLVVFLDDLGQASERVQAAIMQLVLSREINGHKISDTVRFIAATNRRQDKAGVHNVLAPLTTRFHMICELSIAVADWKKWAVEQKLDPRLIAFISFSEESLNDDTQINAEIKPYPTPRTVSYVSAVLKLGFETFADISAVCGEVFAAKFRGFLEICDGLPPFEEIVKSPKKCRIPTEDQSGTLYAVCGMLASRVSVDTIGAVCTYSDRMPIEFQVLLMREMLGIRKEYSDSAEFRKWSNTERALSVMGASQTIPKSAK